MRDLPYTDDVLSGLAQQLTTPALAALLGEDEKRVYRRCRALEKRGLLESVLVEGPTLYFCVDCQEVLTSANHGQCRGDDLRSFSAGVRLWGLTDSGRDRLFRTYALPQAA